MLKQVKRSIDGEFIVNDFIVEGRAIAYNCLAKVGKRFEMILPTALDNCDLSDVGLLINNNDSGIPLARYRENDETSTMELFKKEDGLYFRASLDPNSPDAQNLISALKRNTINKMSFAMLVIMNDENLFADDTTVYIRNISKVREISIVTWPAYSATSAELRDDSTTETDFEKYFDGKEQLNKENELLIAKLKALI